MSACHLKRVLVILLLLSTQTFAQKKIIPLKEGLNKVTSVFGTQFVYNSTLLDGKTTAYNFSNIKKKTAEEVLKGILYPNNLVFLYIKENYYTIVPKEKLSLNTVAQNASTPSHETQTITAAYTMRERRVRVAGVVVDTAGKAVSNVTVTEVGTNNRTVTNSDGSFVISVANNSSELMFSSIGYASKQVAVGNQKEINVTLTQVNARLDEVVVVGYGTQRQKDVTGAVAAVTAKDFNEGELLSPQQLIQGKLAGVNISTNSGKPGASTTVRVRGGTSLTQSNDPLYVIDGVPISTSSGVSQANIRGNGTDVFDQEPINPLMTLNPNDIESVTVLKDASATAIYGSRGANGVIVITTKKGRAGRMQVTYSASAGVSVVAKKLDVLSADQYRKVVKDLGLPLDDKGANTNWQDEIYRTAVAQDHYISFNGGGEKTTYRASLGYGNQEGIMLASKLQRANARININHSALNDRLTFDMRVNYGQTISNAAPVSNTVGSEAGTSMNYESYVFNPTYPVYDSNGNYTFVRPYRINPVSFSTDVLDERTNKRFTGSLSTTYKIINPLSLNVNLGYVDETVDRNSYIKQTNPLGEGMGGYASVQKLGDHSKLLETTLRFNKRFGRTSLDAIAGYSYQYFVDEGDRTTASGFLSDEFKWYSLQAASSVQSVSTYKQSNKLISMYSRANFNYDDRFLVTGTVRRDGSSRFGSGNKWGIFPSGSVAWRISKEEFFKTKAVSDLKVRLSYGITGNQEIGNYNSLTTLGASTNGYLVGGQRITIVLPQQYANPDLRWEQTAQVDAGVDFSLLNGKIHGTIDYYRKKTSDLLFRLDVPSPSSITTQLANVGSVENKGIEIELGSKIIDRKDFSWEADVNFSRNRNKVLSLSNELFQGKDIKTAPLQGQGLSGPYAQLITPGQPLGTFYGRQFIEIKGGVEILGSKDTVIGVAQPKFTFGFSNGFTYKNWSLGINLRGSVGNDVFNLTANNLAYLSNLPGRNVFERAVTDGVTRDQPKKYSSRWIEDGSFVRLDNATLGYTFNMKKSFLTSARVYVSGQNLFIITKYTGLDPEVNSDVSATGVPPLGIDYLAYPRAKTVTLGLNVSF
jgi:TonB-dependent starch-binding outer membrane protein SusC